MTTDTDAERCNPPWHTVACYTGTGITCGGMVCEQHPDRAWPDGDHDCSGPGMPCLHPSNMHLHRDEALRLAREAIRRLMLDRELGGPEVLYREFGAPAHPDSSIAGEAWIERVLEAPAHAAIAAIDEVLK